MFHIVMGNQIMSFSRAGTVTLVALTVAVIIALYVLRSIGLYKMAENQSVNKAWLSFVPCAWIFIAGKLIGTARLFAKPCKKFALITFILFTVSELLTLAYTISALFPLVGVYLSGSDINIYYYMFSGEAVVGAMEYPLYGGILTDGIIQIFNGNGVAIDYVYNEKVIFIFEIVNWVLFVLGGASLFFMFNLYAELFKKYCPSKFMLMTVLSILGGFPIIVFVLKNRQPVDYMEYVRNRYQKFYSSNPYGNPYENPYGQPSGESAPRQEEKPSNEPSEPFAEFFSDKDKKDN